MACCYSRSMLLQMYPDTDGCKCCHFKLKRERFRGIPVNSGYIRTRHQLRERLKREKIEAQNEQAQAKALDTQQPIPAEIPLPTDDVDELVSLIEGTNLNRSDKSNGADQRKLAKKARQRERKEQQRIEEEAQRKAEEERLRRAEEEERLKREAEAREEELRLKKEKKKRRRKNRKLGIVDDCDETVTPAPEGKENSKKSNNVEAPCFAPSGSPALPLSQNATRKCDMVTIRRHPTTPDTTVTITCQSESGGEILLRTLVNGQEILTENSKTDKRVGSHGHVKNNHGSTNKPPATLDNGKADANSKKKNKKKSKKGSQSKKEESSSEDKRDGSGKENGVVVIENNGRIYDARSVNSAASGSHLNYSVVTSGASQLPSPFVKTSSSTSLVGSIRPDDRKSFSYFSGLEGDEIDLSKLKLPPGITITKVNQQMKEHGSDESSEEEDDGTYGIPPPGVGLYNQDSNMIVMNPDNNSDEVDLAGYTSDDFLLGRVQSAEFEEVVSSKTKKLRSKAHRNENEAEVGHKKLKEIASYGVKTKRQDQNGKTAYDRSKKQQTKIGTNNGRPLGKQNVRVLGENTGATPNRMNGKNPATRVVKPSHEIHSKESESSFAQRNRHLAMSSPSHQGIPIKQSRPHTAAIPNSQVPASSLVFNNSSRMVSEKPPTQKLVKRENPIANHHGLSNPPNTYSPFNSNFDFNVGLVTQSMKEVQLQSNGPMVNHPTFQNPPMPRVSPGELDPRNSHGFNWNGAHREFQSAVTRPSRPTSRQGPQHEPDPGNVFGVRTDTSIGGLIDNWQWDPSQQKQQTPASTTNSMGHFLDLDFASAAADMANPFKRSNAYGPVPRTNQNRYSPQNTYDDYTTFDAGFGIDPRAQVHMVPPVSNGFGLPEEPRRASFDGVYNPNMFLTTERPALNSFVSSLSNRIGSVAPGTFQHSELGYRPPGPIGTPLPPPPPRSNQAFDRHDYTSSSNQDSNAQYSLF